MPSRNAVGWASRGADFRAPHAKELETALGIDSLQHMLQCVTDAIGPRFPARHDA
jgi:hypothetical protein